MSNTTFRPMHEVVPEGSQGVAAIRHFTVSKADSQFTAIRAFQHPDAYVPAGNYCELRVHGGIMMTDTSMEKRSNYEIVRFAQGDVFIAGIGIGMILLPILEKPEVTSVTVIEKYPEVVALVEEHIRKAAGENASKLKVIVGDVFEYKPAKGEKYDTIYFDIWPDICTDNLEDMTKLHRKFARAKKDPGSYMESWMRKRLKAQKRREAKQHRETAYFRKTLKASFRCKTEV
jgi:spermidine synthase